MRKRDECPSPAAVRGAALRLLAKREHSVRELQQKLGQRFKDSAPLIEAEVICLRDEGLQSDSRLAEAYIAARAAKGQGPLRIRAELRAKGVAAELIDTAMAASPVDWQRLAEQVAQKKQATLSAPQDLKQKAKLARFMHQRGFPT